MKTFALLINEDSTVYCTLYRSVVAAWDNDCGLNMIIKEDEIEIVEWK